MSRILAAAIISIIIVSLCIMERAEVESVFTESNNYIEKLETEYKKDNTKNTKELSKEFNSYWERKEKLLCMFYSDNELDNLSLDISALPLLSESEDEFLHLCSTVKNRLRLLKEHSGRVFG